MKTDIDIQKEKTLLNIDEIAQKAGFKKDEIENYGKYKAKIEYSVIKDAKPKNNSKLILISAISPTPAGVGKTTNAIGICDAMNKINHNAVVVLRQPSLGPTLGMKGGATGGGYAQVAPMEDINLNFTGDLHAITTANNFLSSLIDNHINYSNKLGLDYRDIKFKKTIDLDDRTLREIIIGLGDKNGFPRRDSFVITAASEVMAILSMSKNISDMKERLGRILLGYSFDGNPIFAKALDAEEPMAVILKDAIKPNLVQTIENNPAIIHMGPFGNIASGTSSIISIKLAMSRSDIVITEAGFGADLGAEKFLNIVSRVGEFTPSAIVIMASIQALKYHGGATVPQLKAENIDAIEKGLDNLKIHIENMLFFGIPVVVGLNKFNTDSEKEISYTLEAIKRFGVSGILTDPYNKGGEGCIEIAEEIIIAANSFSKRKFKYLYELNTPIRDKINKIATKIYRAKGVEYSRKATIDIDKIENIGFNNLPICFAKTQYSISDNPKLLTLDTPYNINVEEVRLSAGAGFIVPIAGSIMTMPGLPMKPNALNFRLDEDGNITGIE